MVKQMLVFSGDFGAVSGLFRESCEAQQNALLFPAVGQGWINQIFLEQVPWLPTIEDRDLYIWSQKGQPEDPPDMSFVEVLIRSDL